MRGRGGSNNNRDSNRKGPNPLTRSYESNGPDVKIRGTAQQVAEKYTTLARDAQSAGDRVMAENYLQHAEHYNRIILTALAQQQAQQQQQQRDNPDDFDNDGDDDRQDSGPRHSEQQQPQRPQYHANGSGPQPVIDDTSAPAAFEAIAAPPARTPESQSGDESQRAEGEEGSRRPRRPRRSLRNKSGQADGGEETQAEVPTAPEAAE